jgi:uracil-DNA glycosylase
MRIGRPEARRARSSKAVCCCWATAPSRTLLGKPLLEARGHVHKIESVRTIATFHPRQLLKRPSDKALAWKDLLLLIEEAP